MLHNYVSNVVAYPKAIIAAVMVVMLSESRRAFDSMQLVVRCRFLR